VTSSEPDPLDALLARSAPPVARPALGAELAAMAADARREALPRRRRAAKLAIGAGVTALLLGGAGVAFGEDVFPWQAWAQDPDVSVSFTLPSGRACETRILVDPTTSAGDGIQTPAPDSPHMREWIRSTDLLAGFDAAKTLTGVPVSTDDGGPFRRLPDGSYERVPGGWTKRMPGPDGTVEPPRTFTEDERYQRAVEMYISERIREESDRTRTADWSSSWQTECEPE